VALDETHLPILPGVRIPLNEIAFSFSRSSGPGGQNVNKVNTKVTLSFDVPGSVSLSAALKARLHEVIPHRLGRDGVIRVASQRHRTQRANREAALKRFAELLAEALTPPAVRKRTRPPRSVAIRRVDEKRKRSACKAERHWRPE
jgi:ribosome-associated protein